MFFLLLLHFHWQFYTVTQQIICSVELIHGCPVDSNILTGLFISRHKPMKNILEDVNKKMNHLLNSSTFFHLQNWKLSLLSCPLSSAAVQIKDAGIPSGQTPLSEMDLKMKKKKHTKHEMFKERWIFQFRKAFTNRPDSERLSREWMRHDDGWNVLRAMLKVNNE